MNLSAPQSNEVAYIIFVKQIKGLHLFLYLSRDRWRQSWIRVLVGCHYVAVLVPPGCCLLAGCIYRLALPRWWQKWPLAAPGLKSTINILGTHRMTREGVFPNNFSKSQCKNLYLSLLLWPKRCGALIGRVEASLEIMSIRKAKWLTQDQTTDWSMCLLTKVHVPWLTLCCFWTTNIFFCLMCLWVGPF